MVNKGLGRHPEGWGSDEHPESCKCKLHKTNQYASRGDLVGIAGKHIRVKKLRGKASRYDCELCDSKAEEWSQIHGTTGLDPEKDFRPLCKRCHRSYDYSRRSFSDKEAKEIREMYSTGNYSWNDLAEIYGVSKRTIGNVINKVTYA